MFKSSGSFLQRSESGQDNTNLVHSNWGDWVVNKKNTYLVRLASLIDTVNNLRLEVVGFEGRNPYWIVYEPTRPSLVDCFYQSGLTLKKMLNENLSRAIDISIDQDTVTRSKQAALDSFTEVRRMYGW